MRFGKLSLCLLIACVSVASPARTSVPQASPEQSVALLSLELMKAVESKDRQALDKIVASDFALRMPGEKKVTRRDEWIGNAATMDWSDFRFENLTVRVHGDNATVSSRLHFHVAPFPFALDSGVVDTWERRDGRWQITGRYLGQSETYERIAFGLGVLAAMALAGLAYAIAWLVKRLRRRSR